MATAPSLSFTTSPEAQLDDLLMRICAALQLDDTRYQLANQSYEAVGQWLESHPDIARLEPGIYSQGSMRLNTTVRPMQGDEYDLDLVCEFSCGPQAFRQPTHALDIVELALRDSALYRPMLSRKKRCMRLSYQHKFHLDILPACHDPRDHGTRILVPDRETKAWTPSDPKGFAAWFHAQSGHLLIKQLLARGEPLPDKEHLERKAPLKLCVQLLKRNRDVRYNGSLGPKPISIVLTTLAGQFYGGESSISAAMSRILSNIVAATRSSRPRLVVLNPTNPHEDLSERWDAEPAAYREFVNYSGELDAVWTQMLRLQGIQKLTMALKQLFGEEIATGAVEGQTREIEAARSRKQLGMHKASGIITSASAPSAVPIRANTFYGEAR